MSARTVKADGEERDVAPSRRDRLIEKAAEEFADKGLSGARINEIASKAGVNKQLVYHYFGSKDALYSAVLEREIMVNRQIDREFRPVPGDPVRSFETFSQHVSRANLQGARLQRLLLDANWHEGRHLDQLNVDYMKDRISILQSILDEGTREGLFRGDIEALDLYISMSGAFSIRVTNRHTFKRTLGADLLSEEGAERSRTNAQVMFLASILATPLPPA